jgi:hypothetical protein
VGLSLQRLVRVRAINYFSVGLKPDLVDVAAAVTIISLTRRKEGQHKIVKGRYRHIEFSLGGEKQQSVQSKVVETKIGCP